MDLARASESTDVAEALLKFFLLELQDRENFSTCLLQCYDLIKPDVALELAWRSKAMDECMPYLLRSLKDLNSRVEGLSKQVEKLSTKAESKERTAPADFAMDPAPFLGLNRNLALTNPADLAPQLRQQQSGAGLW